MRPSIDHVHITVENLKRAEGFYDRFLPLIGFDLALKEHDSVPEHAYEIVEYHNRQFSFGIVSPRKEWSDGKISRRRPGALHHVAFRVDSKEDVDMLFEKAKEAGANIVHEPRLYPEYCRDYYAFFFKDSEGIELEIVSFARSSCFKE